MRISVASTCIFVDFQRLNMITAMCGGRTKLVCIESERNGTGGMLTSLSIESDAVPLQWKTALSLPAPPSDTSLVPPQPSLTGQSPRHPHAECPHQNTPPPSNAFFFEAGALARLSHTYSVIVKEAGHYLPHGPRKFSAPLPAACS